MQRLYEQIIGLIRTGLSFYQHKLQVVTILSRVCHLFELKIKYALAYLYPVFDIL